MRKSHGVGGLSLLAIGVRSWPPTVRSLRIGLYAGLGILIATCLITLIMPNNYESEATHTEGSRTKRDDGAASPQAHFMCRLEGPLSPEDPELIKYALKEYLQPPSTEPYNLHITRSSGKSLPYSWYRTWTISWVFLDGVIRTLFKDEPPGTFVEAGAFDGEYISNTLDLERLKGWTGLLVEVDQDLFARLKKKNRKAWISNSCLATFPYPHKTTLVTMTNHLKNEYALPLRGFNAIAESVDLEERYRNGLPLFQVAQCFPLQTLLLAINMTRINFFSLDVEGVELAVLESFFSSKNPSVIVDVWAIEHRHPKISFNDQDRVNTKFVYWFQSQGYTLYTYGNHTPSDYIFIRNESDIYQRAFSNRPEEYTPYFLS